MKKYRITFYTFLCGLTLLTGCKNELMDYEGKDGLYFDIRNSAPWVKPEQWPHQFFTIIEYGNLSEDEVLLTCKVMTSGTPKDYDRPFTVTANTDSTMATVGPEYYKLASENYVIKAGETSAEISLKVYRTAQMDGDTLQLQLQLHENEFFALPYTNFSDSPGHLPPDENPTFDYNKDAGIHNIFLFDVLSRPALWAGDDVSGVGLFSKYSAKKYRLMMKLSGTTVADYQKGSSTMPMARRSAIAELVAKYLLEQARAKTPVIDEDGTMMYFSPVGTLGGSDAWAPFTKPEDYYK